MYTTATLTHAAEMTVPADNGCCTTTFPYCTRRPRVNTAKSKVKNFYKKQFISMPAISEVFTAFFSSVFFLFSYCRGPFRRYLSAKMAFTMTSRLN